MRPLTVQPLITNAVAAATGASIARTMGNFWSYALSIEGVGAIGATFQIQVSNDGQRWFDFGSPQSLAGNDAVTGQIDGTTPWAFHRCEVSAFSGTGTTANCIACGV